MMTNVITLQEYFNRSGEYYEEPNACEFHGVICGYVCGWHVECEKDGKIRMTSLTCTNDYEEIKLPYESSNWNDLGISADLAISNGWKPTGNIVFRGYYTEHYDIYEHDTYVEEASAEVLQLLDKYVVEENVRLA